MKKVMVVSAALLLGACADLSPENKVMAARATGVVGGGIVGGYIGSMFGGGVGNLIFIAVGAAVGGGAGYYFGDSLLPSDHAKFESSTRFAMNNATDGELVNWTNPKTGVAGSITPTRTFYAGNNTYCRDFSASISAPEGIGNGEGRACRVGGGPWRIQGEV